MVIEWLKIRVDPAIREHYIQKDEEIWTAFLAQFPGFLGKQVWIDPENATDVILVIQWASRAVWKAIPVAQLEQIDQQFAEALGSAAHELVEAREFQVRKFPQVKP